MESSWTFVLVRTSNTCSEPCSSPLEDFSLSVRSCVTSNRRDSSSMEQLRGQRGREGGREGTEREGGGREGGGEGGREGGRGVFVSLCIDNRTT